METKENEKNKINDEEKIKETKEQEESTQSENAILMPNIQASEDDSYSEKRRDLSGIIPQYNGGSSNEPFLESKESKLKSDGAVVLGTFNTETESASFNAGVSLPDSIDIEERKKERKLERDKKRKNKPEEKGKKKKKKMSLSQNITAFVALLVIIFLVCFYFYYKKQPGANEFKARVVTVELGNKLPLRMIEYVEPARGDTVDEMAYVLDTSKIEIDKVGEYDFTVTHRNLKRSGKVIVKDTTEPDLEIRQVVIVEGETYTPEQFVSNCTDLSGCNYYFQEANTEEKYKSPGSYSVFITAKDAYDNSIVKQAPLIIEAKGMRVYYFKESSYNFEEKYEYVEEYELHFTENDIFSDAVILTGNYKKYYYYDNLDSYRQAKEKEYGKINYSFDDENNTIIFTQTISSVGYNYTRMKDVNDYLTEEGFTQSYNPYQR